MPRAKNYPHSTSGPIYATFRAGAREALGRRRQCGWMRKTSICAATFSPVSLTGGGVPIGRFVCALAKSL